ncbi:MAG: hypothetical protein V4503_10220, partial [Gemmatimonadota bacterium]
AALLGNEVVGFGVFEEGIRLAVEQLPDLGAKRRDPVEVPPVQSVRQVDEAIQVFRRLDAPDRRRVRQMTPSSFPIVLKASRAWSI